MKKYISKKCLSIIGMTFIVVSPTLIISSTILSNKLKNKYYLFDNKIFNNTNDLKEYVLENTKEKGYKGDFTKYTFDGETFNTKDQLNNYLEQKFEINKKVTTKVVSDYTINSAGELSAKVLKHESEKAMDVFKGKDGVAYKTRIEALKTFNSIKKTYYDETEGGIYFETKQDYINWLREQKLEKIDPKNNPEKELFYKNGSIYQTKEAIISWLKKNMKRGFEIQGETFSDYNISEFEKFYETNIKNEIENKYLNPVVGADKSSYWFEHVSDNHNGFFIGPRYVETSQKFNGSNISANKFEEISSYSPTLISGIVSLSAFSAFVSFDFETKINSLKKFDKWKFKKEKPFGSGLNGFLDHLTSNNENLKQILAKDNFITIKNEEIQGTFIDTLYGNDSSSSLKSIFEKSTLNLDNLDKNPSNEKEVETLGDFEKLLVASKRISDNSRIYESNAELIREVDYVLKQLIIRIISSNETLIQNILGNNKTKDKTELESLNWLNEIKLNDLISLFLNTQKFYVDNSDKANFLKKVEMISNNIEVMIDKVVNVGKFATETVFKKYEKIDKIEKEKLLLDTIETNKKKGNALNDEDNIEGLLKFLGIKYDPSKTKDASILKNAKMLKGMTNWISIGWDFYKGFSLMDIKTLEFKIDDEQSITYTVPIPKIPLLNIQLAKPNPFLGVNLLNESILNTLLPKSDEEGKPFTVYFVNEKYFITKDAATKELKADVYKNPEKYLRTQSLITSILEKDDSWYFDDIEEMGKIRVGNNLFNTNDETYISFGDYQKLINDQENAFAEQLFYKYFANNEYKQYSDGFGEIFQTAIEACESLNAKLKDTEFDMFVEYKYVTRSNKELYFKTKQEAEDFIMQNEVIDSKLVLSTDYISTAVYDQIREYSEAYYDIYELNYYGDKKYFASLFQINEYLMSRLNIEIIDYNAELLTFNYSDNIFNSSTEFNNWIFNNTQKVNSYKTKGKELISYE